LELHGEAVRTGGKGGGDNWRAGSQVERLAEEVCYHRGGAQAENEVNQALATITTGEADEFTIHGQLHLMSCCSQVVMQVS
jgi:hypothetical protein